MISGYPFNHTGMLNDAIRWLNRLPLNMIHVFRKFYFHIRFR